MLLQITEEQRKRYQFFAILKWHVTETGQVKVSLFW